MRFINKISALALLILSVSLLAGCTRNNGDIGPWFGSWKLTALTADGEADAQYEGNIFWAFQTDVLQLTELMDDGTQLNYDRRWGTWREADGVMYLKFDYTDDANADGYIYRPFAVLHIPYGKEIAMTVIEVKGGRALLKYVAEDGTEYVYTLNKQG